MHELTFLFTDVDMLPQTYVCVCVCVKTHTHTQKRPNSPELAAFKKKNTHARLLTKRQMLLIVFAVI